MDNLSKYSLAIKGLSLGTHHFEYTVDDNFWAAFEGSEITHGTAKVLLEVTKQSNMITLDFDIEGEVEVNCDRCLENFMMPVEYHGTLIVRYAETEIESDGDVMWVHPQETEINLAQYIYESISLSIPYQRVHPLDENGNSTCDPEMLKRFKIVSEEEFEEMFDEGGENGEENETQVSWENQLAALKQKMETEDNK